MRPVDQAREEIHDRAAAIRSGKLPMPEQRPGESDEAFLARIAQARKLDQQRKESA